MKTILKRADGSAITTALILVTVILALSGALLSSLSRLKFYKPESKTFGLAVDIAQKQILTILESDAAWNRTIASNPSMACINDAVTNCPNVYQNFDLYLPAGPVFLQNTGAQGFSKRGYYCQTYDGGAGDSTCVFKIKLQWRCLDAPCVSPVTKKTRISIQLSYFRSVGGDGAATEQNLSNLNYQILRANISGSIKASCEAMGGRLEEGGAHCRIFPAANYNCVTSSGRHMVDRIQGGNVICSNPVGFGDGTNPFKCDPGSAVTGYVEDHPACDVF